MSIPKKCLTFQFLFETYDNTIWWKIYFWIYLILSAVGIFALLQYTPFGLVDILGLLLSVVLLLTTYTYVFKKNILQAGHWKILFWIVIFLFVEEMFDLFVLPKDFVVNLAPFLKSNVPLNAGERLFSWLFSLPGVYAIYKLGKK